MMYFGYVIMALAIILILIGVIGAAYTIFLNKPNQDKFFGGEKNFVANIGAVIKDLPAVITAIATSPPWLLSIVFGCGLFWFGVQVANNGWIFCQSTQSLS
jgi:hypothetical protein